MCINMNYLSLRLGGFFQGFFLSFILDLFLINTLDSSTIQIKNILFASYINRSLITAAVCFFFFFFFFCCPRPWHAKFPGPGIEPVPQQQPEPLQRQRQILNQPEQKPLQYICYSGKYLEIPSRGSREHLSVTRFTPLT